MSGRRAKTLSIAQLESEPLGALETTGHTRPKNRAQCLKETRPCPWVSCKYHLYLDVHPDTGTLKINLADLAPWELPATCALDVADHGEAKLEDIGELLGITKQAVQQIETRALAKLADKVSR